MDLKKSGYKKLGHCYSKKEEAPCFLQPAFFRPIFWTCFFSGSQTDPYFQNKNNGCKLTGPLAEAAVEA